MPTKRGCAPGICQGKPDVYANACAEVNGCDRQSGYDQYAESRAVVAKVQAEMRAEMRSFAEHLLGDEADERQIEAVASLARERWETEAALDYAETRLSEVQARLLELADGYDVDSCDPMPVATSQMLLAVAEKLREVARD